MTDDKRSPAGQSPIDAGTNAPPQRPSPAEADEQRQVDPYKVRRVTIPPDMRVKMLDWWKNRRHENLPQDTIPPDPSAPDEPTPKRGIEPDTIRNFPSRTTPDSVTPVGVSTVPMKSLRGIAVAVALLAGVLLVLVVVFGRGEPPRASEPARAALSAVASIESSPLRKSAVPLPLSSGATNARQPAATSPQTPGPAPSAALSQPATLSARPSAPQRSLAKPKARPTAASPEPRSAQSTSDPDDVPFGPKPK